MAEREVVEKGERREREGRRESERYRGNGRVGRHGGGEQGRSWDKEKWTHV